MKYFTNGQDNANKHHHTSSTRPTTHNTQRASQHTQMRACQLPHTHVFFWVGFVIGGTAGLRMLIISYAYTGGVSACWGRRCSLVLSVFTWLDHSAAVSHRGILRGGDKEGRKDRKEGLDDGRKEELFEIGR